MKLTRFTLALGVVSVAVLAGCGGSAPAPTKTVTGGDRSEPAPGTR